MYSPKLFSRLAKYGSSHQNYRSKIGALRWWLIGLIIILLSSYIIQPEPLLAGRARQTQKPSLMTLEVRYHMPEAGEVFLIWGIDGWQVVSEKIRLPGTIVTKRKLMRTLMDHKDDIFVTKVQIPINTKFDYGFLITKRYDGVPIENIWYGEEDYQVISTADGIIEVKAKSALIRALESFANTFSPRQYLFGGTGIVIGILFSIGVYHRVPKRMKKGILVVAVNVFPIIIVLFIGEIYLRMLGFQPYVRTFPNQYQNDLNGVAWAQSDSLLGWTANKSNPDVNPQGFRDPKDFDKIDLNSDKMRVMILGDSFMAGAGVAKDENVPRLLQAKLTDKFEVFNLSVPGWGIDQMYLAYQQYKDIIDPDMVILAFIDDDVNRVLEAYRKREKLNKPSFTVENGELVLQKSIPKSQFILNKFTQDSVFLSLVLHQIYLMTDAKLIMHHIFLNIAQETQYKKGRFVIVRIPTRDHFDSLAQINRRLNNFEAMFESTDVLYLDPAGEITQIPSWNVDFYLDDGHMNIAGNQFVADYIYKHVFENSNRLSDFSYSNGIPP